MKDAIQVHELKKSYGSHMVLKGLDFQIEKGEIFALLGVNGAGKSTTLECIEGLRKYDSRCDYCKRNNGYSAAIIIFACQYQANGGYQAVCKWNKTKLMMPCLTVLVSKKLQRSSIYNYPQGRKDGYILPLRL